MLSSLSESFFVHSTAWSSDLAGQAGQAAAEVLAKNWTQAVREGVAAGLLLDDVQDVIAQLESWKTTLQLCLTRARPAEGDWFLAPSYDHRHLYLQRRLTSDGVPGTYEQTLAHVLPHDRLPNGNQVMGPVTFATARLLQKAPQLLALYEQLLAKLAQVDDQEAARYRGLLQELFSSEQNPAPSQPDSEVVSCTGNGESHG